MSLTWGGENPLYGGMSKEEWGDAHGFWHGTCAKHGDFWTDSTSCPYCPEKEPEEEES